jgi:phytoene synthase
MTPDEYCEQRAAQSRSSFYYSFLFLPDAQRRAITALYAFCREVDDVVDECREPQIARAKLQWWRDEIARAYDGQAQHPVTRALAAYIALYALQREHFLEIIAGMEMDLDGVSYPDFAALRVYCHRVAGVVGVLAAHIFGYSDARTLEYAEHLGLAFQLTNIIRDVREDAGRGRVYLPREDLTRFGVDAADLRAERTGERLVALLQFQTQRAREYYQRALDALPAADRYPQRSGLIMAAVYRETLDAIERDGFRVLEHRVRLSALRKFWIAWTTARREKLLYLRHAA